MFLRASDNALKKGVEPVRIPFGCITILHFTNFSDFSRYDAKR